MSQPNLPRVTRVVTADQMRELDSRATDEFGIPSLLLMENAGRAVFEVAVDLLEGDVRGKRVLVVCGPGNNGGDGFVAARHLYNAGALPTIAYYGDRDKAKGDALTNIVIAEKMGLDVIRSPLDGSFWADAQADYVLIIDALLGTGTKGEIREPFSQVISLINDWRMWTKRPVLAVDIPSGVNADTGALCGIAICADVTVTFAFPKIGLVTYPGASCVGELAVADIGIPDKAQPPDPGVSLLDADAIRLFCPEPRRPDGHKGDYGHVAIIAGSVGLTGAAALAATGALRIGAGLVSVAVPASLNDIMEVKLTEAMTIPVPEGKTGAFGIASLAKVLEIIDERDAAVIGPGFGRDEDTIAFTLELLKRLNKPAVVDADALYAISTEVDVLKGCKAPLVITPHPGEMARLMGTGIQHVQSNRLEAARSFAQQFGVVVVLKGAGTVVADPDGQAYINTTGTPGMATGGTGDVLAGMIGGRLARHGNPRYASCESVYLHGRAGEIAAKRIGEDAMIASDVAEYISDAIQELIGEAEDELSQRMPSRRRLLRPTHQRSCISATIHDLLKDHTRKE